MDGIGDMMMIVWAGLGVRIENELETQENITIWISVPKRSYHLNQEGIEMSGMFLAKRYKQALIKMGIKRLTVKAKVRDDIWTEEKAQEAKLQMRKLLFGSQY